MAQLSVAVLGSVRVHRDGVPCPVRGRRQRALVAALAVRHPRAVPVEALVDAVWDDEPPAGARSTLQTYVSRLRGVLGDDAIIHDPAGYRFGTGTVVDLHAARADLVDGRELLATDPPAAARRLAGALDRWDGVALAEVADVEWFQPTVAGLQELHDALATTLADALVRSGRAPEAVESLEASVHTNPFDEHAQLLLVRALADAGRATDALRAAERYRTRLREETGLDPGPELADLEQAILSGTAERPVPPGAPTHAAAPSDAAPPPAGARLSRPTALVGRDAVLADLRALLQRHRLVTVLGPGGVGKTRLVAELLVDPPEPRTVVVELAPSDPGSVLAAVAAAVGHHGPAPDAGRLAQTLAADGAAVLVLDSCEHVVTEVRPLVRGLLDAHPDLAVLATSRTALALPDEQLVALQPLSTEGERPPALEVFTAALARARPGADDLRPPDEVDARALCQRLDGLPLALELAAGRAAVLGVRELLAALERSSSVLEAPPGSRPGRHTSLRALVGWSADLLDDDARRLLRALAVFRGEIDVDAVDRVGGVVVDAPARACAVLVDASLLALGRDPGRFRMLDVVRAYALDDLDGHPDEPEVRRAHAAWTAARATAVTAALAGPREGELADALERLRPDLRAAFAWASAARDTAALDRLADAVAGPLLYRPDAEAADLLVELATAHRADPDGRGAALAAAGARAAALTGRLSDAADLAHQALASAAVLEAPEVASRAHHALGMVALYEGRFRDADRAFVAAAAAAVAGPTRCDALGGAALACCFAGEPAAADAQAAAHRAAAEATRSPTALAFAGYIDGERRLAAGDAAAAIEAFDAAAETAWAVQAPLVWGLASTVLAATLTRQGRHREAAARLPTLLRRWQRTATWPQLWTSLRLIAEVLTALDHHEPAAVLLEAANPDHGAPTLQGDDRAAADALRARVQARLAPDQVQLVRARAATLDRHQLLDLAATSLADAAG